MIRLPLLRATLRSYRNMLRRAHRRNPAAVNALALVSVLAYLALMAVQMQALASTIDLSTLTQLQATQLVGVAQAAAASVAAASLGVFMFLGLVDTAPAGLGVVAAVHDIGRVRLAWSVTGLDVAIASVAGLALTGPICLVTTHQVAQLAGATPATGWSVGALVTLSAAVGGAATAAAVTTLLRALLGRSLSRDTLRSLTLVALGLLLAGGVGTVLAGHPSGLVVLCPPFLLVEATRGLMPAALLSVLTLGWLVLSVSAFSLLHPGAVITRRSGHTRIDLHRVGGLPGAIVSTFLREAMYMSTIVLVVAIAGGVAFTRAHGRIDGPQAGMLLLLALSMSGLAVVTVWFEVSNSGWVFRCREHAHSRVVRCAVVVALVLSLAWAAVVIALQSASVDVPQAVVLLASVIMSTAVAGLASVLVFRDGTSAEDRGALMLAGLLAVLLTGLIWLVVSRIGDGDVTGPLAQLAAALGATAGAVLIARHQEGELA